MCMCVCVCARVYGCICGCMYRDQSCGEALQLDVRALEVYHPSLGCHTIHPVVCMCCECSYLGGYPIHFCFYTHGNRKKYSENHHQGQPEAASHASTYCITFIHPDPAPPTHVVAYPRPPRPARPEAALGRAKTTFPTPLATPPRVVVEVCACVK